MTVGRRILTPTVAGAGKYSDVLEGRERIESRVVSDNPGPLSSGGRADPSTNGKRRAAARGWRFPPWEIGGIFVAAAQKWSEDSAPTLGASIAFYTVFSLSPVMLTVLAIAGAVFGDSGRLQQVIWNLLTNAIKFTPADGRIGLTLSIESGLAVIAVEDSGKGIPPELLPRVFDLFVQAEQPIDRLTSLIFEH